MNLNSPPSHFPMHQITHDASDHELYLHHPFLPNPSPSVSCHFFFDPSQHHSGFYDHHHHLYRPNHVPDDQDYGGSSTCDEIKNKVVDSSGLKLGLWKNEDVVDDEHRQSKHNNPMKWMSSKMRVMQKMKHTDHHDRAALKITSSADQKVQQPSSSTDLSSNSSSYNNNSPIRVCSDCNTTKTPLWRSGPKGPKSLCNACGIRQRKARRAMAAAAAAAAAAATNGAAASTSDQSSAVKIKLQHKGKLGKNGHPSQLKKRCKTAVAAATAATTTTTTAAGSPPSTGKKQLGFEEFLISLSKNLALHHVFPDDEKDAAILLMALSSGLVNG